MNLLFLVGLFAGQTEVTILPTAKAKLEIAVPVTVSIGAEGTKITGPGIALFLASKGAPTPTPTPTPTPPTPEPEGALNARAQSFKAALFASVADVTRRKEGAHKAIEPIQSALSQAGGLGWNGQQLLDALAKGLAESGTKEDWAGFRFGDWLSQQTGAQTVEGIAAVLADVVAACKQMGK